MQKITMKLAPLAVLVALIMPGSALAADPASVICGSGNNTSKGQILQGIGSAGTDCTGAGVNSAVATVVKILSIVVGIAAVIVIILSGLKYVTSAGDSNGISSAKNTLVYALVGLAVAALAQVLVRFVLFNVK